MVRIFAIALIAFAVALAAIADPVIPPKSWKGVSLTNIETSIAESNWPIRDVDVATKPWSTYFKYKRARVFGPLRDRDVFELLALAEIGRSARFKAVDQRCGAVWDVSLRGNSNFASVTYTQRCDARDGPGAEVIYGSTPSGWEVIHAMDKWGS